MSDTNTGGPAFPTSTENGANSGEPGMTLREYLVAHAPITLSDAVEWLDTYGGEVVGPWHPETVMACLADLRITYADAVLKARAAK